MNFALADLIVQCALNACVRADAAGRLGGSIPDVGEKRADERADHIAR